MTVSTSANNILDWKKPAHEEIAFFHGVEVRKLTDDQIEHLANTCGDSIKKFKESTLASSNKLQGKIEKLVERSAGLMEIFDDELRDDYQEGKEVKTDFTSLDNAIDWTKPILSTVVLMYGLDVAKCSDEFLEGLADKCEKEIKLLTESSIAGTKKGQAKIAVFTDRLEAIVKAFDSELRVDKA